MTLLRFLLILITFILLNVYLFMRGWQALPARNGLHILYTIVFLAASTSVFIAIFAGNRLPLWLSHAFETIGGYWMILFVFILFGALLGDLLRIANHYFGIFPPVVIANYQAAKLGYFAFVMLALLLISIIGFFRFSNPSVTRLEIPVFDPRKNSSSVHLVAISDIHLGNLIHKGRLDKWVNAINLQKPDIIMIVGDLIDHNLQAVELQNMEEELLKLKATHGVYAIPGNHDYYAGIHGAIAFMKKAGIHVLRDQAVTINNQFILIGRDDITNKERKSLKSMLDGFTSDMPRIVLDHQPHSLDESLENNIDLHISGHTHNGQIFPLNLIVSKIYDLGYGYQKKDNTHFYVSSGLGLWGAPLRIGTRSEIVSIYLTVN